MENIPFDRNKCVFMSRRISFYSFLQFDFDPSPCHYRIAAAVAFLFGPHRTDICRRIVQLVHTRAEHIVVHIYCCYDWYCCSLDDIGRLWVAKLGTDYFDVEHTDWFTRFAVHIMAAITKLIFFAHTIVISIHFAFIRSSLSHRHPLHSIVQ